MPGSPVSLLAGVSLLEENSTELLNCCVSLEDKSPGSLLEEDSTGASPEDAVTSDEDMTSSEDGIRTSMLEDDVTDSSSSGPELFESEEHAKSTALAAVTIISDAAVFWNTL